MPIPSIWVRYCGKALMRASKRRQSYLSRQHATSAWAFWRGTPCDQSPTVSRSGHRVDASRRLRSSIALCGTDTLKGVTSSVALGSTNGAALSSLPWAFIGTSPAGSRPAPPVTADSKPAPPVAAAASMNLRRETWGAGTPLPFSTSFFMSVAPECCSVLAQLENEQRAALRNHGFGPLYLVDPVLNALRIQSPTGRDRYVLLAIDLKGCGNTKHTGGRREAPQFISRASIERPELPVGRSTREHHIPASHQQRRKEDGFEVVLPDALARIQVPGLKLAKMIGRTCAGANRPEDAFHFVSDIEPAGVRLRHDTLREKAADVVIRRDVQELRLWAPCLRWPVLAAADARAELTALFGTRTLRFIDDRPPRLRVNRREHIVIRERKGVEKPQLSLIAIQDPEVSVAAGVRSRLDQLSVDLRVDQQWRRHLIPVPRVVRRVLVKALQCAGLEVERQRGVGIQIIARTIVSDPRRRISGAPVGDVRFGIKHTGDPDRATSALVCIAPPGRPAWLIGRGHGVGAPDSLAGLGVEGAHRASDAKFSTGVTDEDLASRRERRQRRVAAGLVVIDLDRPGFFARGGIQGHEFAIGGCHVHAVTI